MVEKSLWLQSSTAESFLANRVANSVYSQVEGIEKHREVLEGLAFSLADTRSAPNVPSDIYEMVERLRIEFPELNRVDPMQAFPKNNTDLTANVFSCIAYEFSNWTSTPTDRGAVDTPAILAADMVALAAALWLRPRGSVPMEQLYSLIFEEEDSRLTSRSEIGQLLSEVRWYDPCVGGGVFPVAVIRLLARFGVAPDPALLLNIVGRDTDPFAITATRIRVALTISALTGKSYGTTRAHLPDSFLLEDSLERFTEKPFYVPVARDLFSLAEANTKTSDIITKAIDEKLFDIVIANPPYVRADRLPIVTKARLKTAYPSVANGAADLYNYFIAHGLLSLREGGILCYVSPASFQKSKYGRNTRTYISRQGSVEVLFDFDELPVFEIASVHPSVYAIRKGERQGTVTAYGFQALPRNLPLLHGLKHGEEMPASNISLDGWHVGLPGIEDVIRALRRDAIPLARYAGEIYSGIKTGAKNVFVLSRTEAESLSRDDTSKQFLRRMLRPVSIRAWGAKWDGAHMILVRKGETVPEDSLLMHHFREHETVLSQRIDAQGHPTWYGLRECKYYDVFTRPKIIFPDIASECRFALDIEGFFIPDGAFMLPLGDYFLLGVLNSCVGRFYFQARCNSIGNPHRRGRLRFKKTYVAEFPVPNPAEKTAAARREIADLARSLSMGAAGPDAAERIDRLALEIYNIPKDLCYPMMKNS